MNYTICLYLLYLASSICLTIWVGRTFHKNGRIFLVDAFHQNEKLADSINHLLLVGFYLVNFGYVNLALRYGDKPTNLETMLEILEHEDWRRLARARRDALLQPVRLLAHAPARSAP